MPTSPEFLVDFLIGGTQKGGTTALARFLGSHPEICLPKYKEVHLFDAPDYPKMGQEEVSARYRKAFPKELRGRIVGESTPVSMYLPWVPARVRQYNPAMKWILLLRHPVERAISHYSMERARKAEWLPMAAALRLEKFRCWWDRGWSEWSSSLRHHSYLDRGFYSRQIGNLWDCFPRAQVLILTNEQLREQHAETLLLVYAFLGVNDRTILPAPETVFASESKASVSPATAAWMRKRFAGEIDRLEEMLGRSLETWRS